MKHLLLLSLCCLLMVSVSAYGGSLEESLQKLAGTGVQGYVGPIVTAFGTDLNGGWFHKSPSAEMYGFDLEFGVVAMGSSFNAASKTIPAGSGGLITFDAAQSLALAQSIPNYNLLPAAQQQAIQNKIANTPFNVQLSGPTIVGSSSDFVQMKVPGQTITVNGQQFTIPDNVITTTLTGYKDNLNTLPLGAAQLTLGTLVGTQVTFRWLPSYQDPSFGKLKYFGFGIQHNPGIWFPTPLPVNLALCFFTQTLDAGTVLTSKATAYGISASKTFGPGPVNVTPVRRGHAGEFNDDGQLCVYPYLASAAKRHSAGECQPSAQRRRQSEGDCGTEHKTSLP